MKFRLLRKTDIIIIAVCLIAAGILLIYRFTGSDRLTAEITVNGEVTDTIDLSKVDSRIEIKPDTDPAVVIAAEDGKIWFEEADCPDKICVKTGKLYRRGDTAVCLPAGVVISISDPSVDALTY